MKLALPSVINVGQKTTVELIAPLDITNIFISCCYCDKYLEKLITSITFITPTPRSDYLMFNKDAQLFTTLPVYFLKKIF